jgi:hypothetical protein
VGVIHVTSILSREFKDMPFGREDGTCRCLVDRILFVEQKIQVLVLKDV